MRRRRAGPRRQLCWCQLLAEIARHLRRGAAPCGLGQRSANATGPVSDRGRGRTQCQRRDPELGGDDSSRQLRSARSRSSERPRPDCARVDRRDGCSWRGNERVRVAVEFPARRPCGRDQIPALAPVVRPQSRSTFVSGFSLEPRSPRDHPCHGQRRSLRPSGARSPGAAPGLSAPPASSIRRRSLRAMVSSKLAVRSLLRHLLGADRDDAADFEPRKQAGGILPRHADVGHRKDVGNAGCEDEDHRVAEDLVGRRAVRPLAHVPDVAGHRLSESLTSSKTAAGPATIITPTASLHICGDMNTGA